MLPSPASCWEAALMTSTQMLCQRCSHCLFLLASDRSLQRQHELIFSIEPSHVLYTSCVFVPSSVSCTRQKRETQEGDRQAGQFGVKGQCRDREIAIQDLAEVRGRPPGAALLGPAGVTQRSLSHISITVQHIPLLVSSLCSGAFSLPVASSAVSQAR